MIYGLIEEKLENKLKEIKEAGLYKTERIITSAQDITIKISSGEEVLNFCSNNYLGLSNNTAVVQAAKDTLDSHGFGMSSVRFICGTQNIHKELEKKIASFFHCEDTILYAAAFDANGGLFEPLLTDQDAIISDALNHASIIDGVRLCKASRYRYVNNNMEDLENKLIEANKNKHRFKIIVTDGVFSMDGIVAQLDKICDLADKYGALVMVDECHAAGFIGKTGRGTIELKGVLGRVDIITGTLGKALGGAMGGYTTGKKEIIEILRQQSRPYLFSNSLAPAIIGGTLKVFEIISEDPSLRNQLEFNTAYFRTEMEKAGFNLIGADAAIVPVMTYDAKLSQEMSDALLVEGIYVIGFFYPVVPKEMARIRVQLSASHKKEHLDKAIKAFIKVGKRFNLIS
jgi:glycine C-acetyltransferase